MTTEIELLPMPKDKAYGMYQAGSYDQMQAHAVARAQLLAALDQAILEVGVECVAAALLERALEARNEQAIL